MMRTLNYVLYYSLLTFFSQRAKPATRHEMTQFHTDEYIDFLQKVTPDNMDNFAKEQGKYNVGDDCPVGSALVAVWRGQLASIGANATLPSTGLVDFITPKRVKLVVSAMSTVSRSACEK
jgi:hypothetical protein